MTIENITAWKVTSKQYGTHVFEDEREAKKLELKSELKEKINSISNGGETDYTDLFTMLLWNHPDYVRELLKKFCNSESK